jgi:enamine deaminase RidA (YjgF/YER057c/UK114 family)
VVEATGPNRLIYIAGQLGLDMENKLVGMAGDFRAQANQAIENLKLALADAGATIKDVVKINNYLVDMTHISIFREVRDAHFNMSAPPASTTVAISQLARPGALFEIEAIAVLPAKAAAKASSAIGLILRCPRCSRTGRSSAGQRGSEESAELMFCTT